MNYHCLFVLWITTFQSSSGECWIKLSEYNCSHLFLIFISGLLQHPIFWYVTVGSLNFLFLQYCFLCIILADNFMCQSIHFSLMSFLRCLCCQLTRDLTDTVFLVPLSYLFGFCVASGGIIEIQYCIDVVGCSVILFS